MVTVLQFQVAICIAVYIVRKLPTIEKFHFVNKRRWLYFMICFFTVPIVIILLRRQLIPPKDNIACFYLTDLDTLPDIMEVEPKKGKSIYFHETSCRSSDKGKITISSRQACAVESAAKMNPNLDVYLLYSSPGIIKFEGDQSDKLLEALLSYRNVNIMYVDYGKYTQGTLLETLYGYGKIDSSKYVVSHASDVLRYLTLWKYGGIYLDLDVIVLRSLEDLPLNYAGIESSANIGSAILSFDAAGVGHNMVEECLEDLKYNFDGQNFNYNGPEVITRLLKCRCDTKNLTEMVTKDCNGFKVYPPDVFYPLSQRNGSWQLYVEDSSLHSIFELIKDSYIIHDASNTQSADRKLFLTSNTPYTHFAEQFCPQVTNIFETFSKHFIPRRPGQN